MSEQASVSIAERSTAPADGPAWRKASLSDVRLALGARLQLVGGNSGQESLTTLVGYVEGNYVIARIPAETGLSADMKPGEPLTVRLFDGLQAVRFATTVVRVLYAPFSLLMLQYPESIELQRLRRLPRINVDISASLSLETDREDRLANARMVDLSPTGARLHVTGFKPDVAQSCRLVFALTLEDDTPAMGIRVPALVRTVKALGSAAHTVGVQFHSVSPGQRAVLRAFVFERLIGQPGY